MKRYNYDLLEQCFINFQNNIPLDIYKDNIKYCYNEESTGELDKVLWEITKDEKFYAAIHKIIIEVVNNNSVNVKPYPN